MVENSLIALVETMNLTGDIVPNYMVQRLFTDKGSNSDQKCCHCGILYEKILKVQNERGASSLERDVYTPGNTLHGRI